MKSIFNPFHHVSSANTGGELVSKNHRTAIRPAFSALKVIAPILFVPFFANAAVTLDVSGIGNNATFSSIVWSLSDLNGTPPTVATPALGAGTTTITGSFSGAGTYASGETLSVTMTASTAWVKADAISNLANFGTYVNGLTKENVFIFDNHFNVGNNVMDGTTEALFIAVNTGNTSGAVSFTNMGFQLTGGADEADFLIWDFETQTLLANQTAKSSSLPLGTFSLTTGDLLVIATTPGNTGNYRVDNFTLDIGTGAVPEPSRTILLGAGLTLLVARRRRSGLA